MSDFSYNAAKHYDRVTDAWGLLLGPELHYGVFVTGDEHLLAATGRLTDVMIDAADIAPGVEILDVGCGTGAPACRLATEHDVHVVGITTSDAGVLAARQRAADVGVEHRVAFECRDGMDNGLPDASFDRVWVLESSHLMRQRDRLMAECSRVLRPGGILALCDIMLRRPIPFEEVRRLRQPLSLLRAVFGDARMEALGTYADLARQNELVVNEQRDLTAGTRPTFARWRENAERHRESVIARLTEQDWRRFVDACDVLEGFWDDGTLGYGLLVASKPERPTSTAASG